MKLLDHRRTLTEKLVSLIRCSLADESMQQMAAKIRHFYDLHHLLQDSECRVYLQSDDFKKDFKEVWTEVEAELKYSQMRLVFPTMYLSLNHEEKLTFFRAAFKIYG